MEPAWTLLDETLSYETLHLDSTDAMPHPDCPLHRCLHCHTDLPHSLLQEHMLREHGYKSVVFKCHVCFARFRNRSELKDHRSVKHSIEQAQCEICFITIGKKYLAKHYQNVHCPRNSFEKCDLCNKLLKSKDTLKDHIRSVHMQSEMMPCEICQQEFKSKRYLVNHMRNVHPKGDKVHKCVECEKIFKSRMCLHQHVKNVHPPESAAVQCDVCDKVFKTKANLAQHNKHCHPESGKSYRRSGRKKLKANDAELDMFLNEKLEALTRNFLSDSSHNSFTNVPNESCSNNSLLAKNSKRVSRDTTVGRSCSLQRSVTTQDPLYESTDLSLPVSSTFDPDKVFSDKFFDSQKLVNESFSGPELKGSLNHAYNTSVISEQKFESFV